MKKMNITEKVGFALILVGFVLMFFKGNVENVTFAKVVEKNELFYWGGLLIWALGYMQREAQNKKQDKDDKK